MRRQAGRQRLPSLDHAEKVQNEKTKLRPVREIGRNAHGAIHRHACIQQRRKFLREEQHVALVTQRESRHFQFERLLLLNSDVNGRQPLLAQFARNGLIGFRCKAAGAQLAVTGYGAKEVSGHQISWVTRITSSAVLTPARTFCQPSSRKLPMPWRRATAVICEASAFAMMTLRMSSFRSISSKIPTRPVYPVPEQCSQPAPRNAPIVSPSGVIAVPAETLQWRQITRTSRCASTATNDEEIR